MSCSNSGKEQGNHFAIPSYNRPQLAIRSIILDSIVLDKVNSSYVGFLRVVNDSLLFFDKRFCWVFTFDRNGRHFNRYLGQGDGPREISCRYILDYCPLPNGKHFVIGPSWDCYLYTKGWTIESKSILYWTVEHSKQEMLANPLPDMQGLYSLAYEGNFRVRAVDKYVYLPIRSQHPTFNGFTSTEYYRDGRILARVNPNTGRVEGIFGRRSPYYLRYTYIGQFAYFNFDVGGNCLYVNHEPDSIIYTYNEEMVAQTAFGISGKSMDTDYQQIASLEDARKYALLDRETKGYYHWIKYVDRKDLLFRGYIRGSGAKCNGMQIYRNAILIGELDVPKGFQVEGYIEPYFYTNAIIDEENETIKVYRFKIDD
jgi:hypothetical protein